MSSNIDLARENMITKIASLPNVYIKHLQIDEADLSFSEKYSCLENLFINKPSIFLERYHTYLEKQDIILFEKLKNLSMVEHYMNQIQFDHIIKQNPKLSKYARRNKYYKILEQLIDEGDYFSDYEMKKRDPFLYDQMVGQYLNEDEIAENAKLALSFSLSGHLMNHLQAMQNNELYEHQLKIEKSITEEYDSDDPIENTPDKDNMFEEQDNKSLLRKEFTAIMHQRFLDGLDDFNYDDYKYDHDPELLDIINRDKEDAYFDEDDKNENFDDMDNHQEAVALSNDICASYEDDIFIKNDLLNNDEYINFKNNFSIEHDNTKESLN